MKNYDSWILTTTRLASPGATQPRRVEEIGVRHLSGHAHSARRVLAISETGPPIDNGVGFSRMHIPPPHYCLWGSTKIWAKLVH
jgi:hypothetical protein